jgi:hypothetical protein
MNSLQILMHNIKFGDLSLTYEDLCESYQILIADIENEVNLNAKANMIKCLIDSLKEAIEYTHQFNQSQHPHLRKYAEQVSDYAAKVVEKWQPHLTAATANGLFAKSTSVPPKSSVVNDNNNYPGNH